MTPVPDRALGLGTVGRDLGALSADEIDRRGAPTRAMQGGFCGRHSSRYVALCFEKRGHGVETWHGALDCEKPPRGSC